MFKIDTKFDEPPVNRTAKVYAGHNSATVHVPAAWDGLKVLCIVLPEDMQIAAREREEMRQAIKDAQEA